MDSQLNAKLADLELGSGGTVGRADSRTENKGTAGGNMQNLSNDELLENWAAPEVHTSALVVDIIRLSVHVAMDSLGMLLSVASSVDERLLTSFYSDS